MTDLVTDLTVEDRKVIFGQGDVTKVEPEQIVQLPNREETKADQIKETNDQFAALQNKGNDLLQRVKEAGERIDLGCSHLQVATGEEKGSKIYQAMVRVFGKRTSTVTYPDYKAALDIRKRLAEEDRAKLREK